MSLKTDVSYDCKIAETALHQLYDKAQSLGIPFDPYPFITVIRDTYKMICDKIDEKQAEESNVQ